MAFFNPTRFVSQPGLGLGTNARSWQVKMRKLRESRLLGRVFAASLVKLEEIAERLGVRYVVNLARCPAR
jgi:hypothetical protein